MSALKESASHKEWRRMRRHVKAETWALQKQKQQEQKPRKKTKFTALTDY